MDFRDQIKSLTGNELKVLMYQFCCTGKDDSGANRSLKRIADDLQISQRSVKRARQALRDRGVFLIEGHTDNGIPIEKVILPSTEQMLNHENGVTPTTRWGDTSGLDHESGKVRQGVPAQTPGGVTGGLRGVSPLAHNVYTIYSPSHKP